MANAIPPAPGQWGRGHGGGARGKGAQLMGGFATTDEPSRWLQFVRHLWLSRFPPTQSVSDHIVSSGTHCHHTRRSTVEHRNTKHEASIPQHTKPLSPQMEGPPGKLIGRGGGVQLLFRGGGYVLHAGARHILRFRSIGRDTQASEGT